MHELRVITHSGATISYVAPAFHACRLQSLDALAARPKSMEVRND